MSVYNYIKKVIEKDGAAHFTLIDPPKQTVKDAGDIAEQAQDAGTDLIMVGGSVGGAYLFDETVKIIKDKVSVPVVLFPGGGTYYSPSIDAVFYLSLLNSNNPYWIVGVQALYSLFCKKIKLETISMAYLIIEPGGMAGWVGETKLLPRDYPELAASYCALADIVGFKMVYLEAGSGVKQAVPINLVYASKKYLKVPLVVGGGITDEKTAQSLVTAGADAIVTGTIVERKKDVKEHLGKIVKAIKKC
jgi:phosphoglycerol geranylgeranyltransferase